MVRLLFVLVLCGTEIATASWDFTPARYRALRDRGGRLELAADSAWLPPELLENLRVAADFILGADDGIVRSTGINRRDWYHGHLGCAKTREEKVHYRFHRLLAEFREDRSAFEGESYRVAPALLPDFFRLIRIYEPAFGALGRNALASRALCPGPVVVYHTFEDNMPPGMEYNDPRRNIIVPIGGRAAPYHVRGYAASSWTVEYSQALEFDFLVDDEARVHATMAPSTNLARITGVP